MKLILNIKRFDDLQTLMGDAFKEGITVDEINAFLSDKKLADLSTGGYVDKNKYEADLRQSKAEASKYKDELNAKLTDSEKSAQADKEKDDLIKQLQNQIKESNIRNSKSSAEAAFAESKNLLEIADDDSDYANFMSSISTEDADKSKNLAKYVNKLVQDAYKKGQKDGTKDSMGNMGKDVKTGGSKTESLSFGTKLAREVGHKTDNSNLYFK